MTERKTKQFIIHCTEAQHARVKALAEEAGKPISHWLVGLLNAGWKATRPPRPPVSVPVARSNPVLIDGVERALRWLDFDGAWSLGPAPWQLSTRLVVLRKSGLVESRTVRAYPIKLNWRITDRGREYLAKFYPAAVMSTSPGVHPSLPDPAFSASSGTDTVRVEDLK